MHMVTRDQPIARHYHPVADDPRMAELADCRASAPAKNGLRTITICEFKVGQYLPIKTQIILRVRYGPTLQQILFSKLEQGYTVNRVLHGSAEQCYMVGDPSTGILRYAITVT